MTKSSTIRYSLTEGYSRTDPSDKTTFLYTLSYILTLNVSLSNKCIYHDLNSYFNPIILYEEGGIFNFGYVEIQKQPEDNLVHLTSRIVDENGLTRPNSLLDLNPQQ